MCVCNKYLSLLSLFFQNLESRFRQEKFTNNEFGVEWQAFLNNYICKRSLQVTYKSIEEKFEVHGMFTWKP